MRRALCHPDRPNHDGKGKCWACAAPNTAHQQVSKREVNCLGDYMTLVIHPRRGVLRVDEVIAPMVERMWRLGVDVDNRMATHSWTRDTGARWGLDSYFEFRDQEVYDTHQISDQSLTLASRLMNMLEEVERGISHRPWWTWGHFLLGGGERSFLRLPQQDLPLLSQLLWQVEAQTEGGLGLGLPLSSSTRHELNAPDATSDGRWTGPFRKYPDPGLA
ncbi:MAG: hypothetical protein ACYDB4_19400 [Candidatus Dormibacteraceae bacterium]